MENHLEVSEALSLPFVKFPDENRDYEEDDNGLETIAPHTISTNTRSFKHARTHA